MLKFLKISNLAIIDEVEVEFHSGFSILTGETGAGKSILIGALNLLSGAKVSQDLIRTGEEEASVEALFEVPEGCPFPGDLGEAAPETGEVILTRRVFRSGRSRCFINGSLSTVKTLQSVARSLVGIFGQHEHHVLLNPEEHVEILDQFGLLEENRRQTTAAFNLWAESLKNLEKTGEKLEELQRQGRENAAAIEELTAADLKPGEEEELTREREILKKAGQIREKAFHAHQALYSRSGSIIESFSDVKKSVDYLASVNPKLLSIKENLEEALYRIEDVAIELRAVADRTQSDPMRLEHIEERLVLIRRLKRKYGTELDGLLLHLEDLNRDAGAILEVRAALKRLAEEVEEKRENYLNTARALTSARKGAARDLEAAMKKELVELSMPDAAFTVSFDEFERERGTAQGLEKVEFFLAANPGEAPRPLANIASGGELSRIMLALKALQVDEHGTSTVIFDEVDAGIGGHTAAAVGTRLARVARRQQVLCVTHLHQIAALADHHLSVRKLVQDRRTIIQVTPLDHEMRVEELTRMLGASPGSESAREHVRGLMEVPAAEVPG